jgi:putative sigma-54 modulation protein
MKMMKCTANKVLCSSSSATTTTSCVLGRHRHVVVGRGRRAADRSNTVVMAAGPQRFGSSGQKSRRTKSVTQLQVVVDSESSGSDLGSNTLKLNIQGRHLKVTDSISKYVEEQVLRAVSHFMHHHHDVNKGKNSPISRTDVRLSTRGGPKKNTKGPQLQKSEVTIFTTIGVVRAEVESQDLYNSIDEACKTAERKLRKLKEKAVAKGVWNGHGVRQSKRDSIKSKYDYLESEENEEEALEYMSEWDMDSFVESVDAQSMSQADEDMKIYRKKEVDLIPMTVEDALESLQFLGHDFFMFLEKSSNEIKVVYKRDVAGYGVLTPVFPPKQ